METDIPLNVTAQYECCNFSYAAWVRLSGQGAMFNEGSKQHLSPWVMSL
jgi:hypothetical protein